MQNIIVAGGDIRLSHTAEALRVQGNTVQYTPEADLRLLQSADVLVLPVPVSRDGIHLWTSRSENAVTLAEAASVVRKDCRVFCGMPNKETANLFFGRGIRLYDYAAREEFAVRNAVPTAEGVVGILMELLPVTLRGAQITVTGYGRTARACAKVLSAMGAHVTIAARRCSALAAANADGYDSLYLRELHRFIAEADAVVNTVPEPVLRTEILSAMRSDCPIVEIASAPYGTVPAETAHFGIRVRYAPSLPGKVAPKTAGIIIADTVLNILREGSE